MSAAFERVFAACAHVDRVNFNVKQNHEIAPRAMLWTWPTGR